jgi:C4-dicarboxylate-specific signal transduction histidine kinase
MQKSSNRNISFERFETTPDTLCPAFDANFSRRVADAAVAAALPIWAQQHQSGTPNEPTHGSCAGSVDIMSASIAHELSQPLAAIVMSVGVCLRSLRKDRPDIAAGLVASERALHAAMRASRILQGTRNLMSGREPRREIIDIGALARTAVAVCQTEIDNAGATVCVDTASTVHPAVSDPVALEQVLINLITNALQAMAEMPQPCRHVHICVDSQDDDHVRLAVRDFGPGISPTAMQRLFDPFFTTKELGLGLGLTISRMAVVACAGQLIARNHPEGGAIFECLLPRVRRKTSHEPPGIGATLSPQAA